MIIDPQSYVPLEVQRRLATAGAAQPPVDQPVRRRQRPHRGPVLRFTAWATGRTAYI
ncbi:hypothetical protein [Aeromicrobium alkaliterrae]|uniref:Uncharacterized protein n=1 Tax=Aeromicrobium alkaliterrae TaxID=302168 RepID=A0ABN2JKU4_9ACTN